MRQMGIFWLVYLCTGKLSLFAPLTGPHTSLQERRRVFILSFSPPALLHWLRWLSKNMCPPRVLPSPVVRDVSPTPPVTVPGKILPPSVDLCPKSKYLQYPRRLFVLSISSSPQNTQSSPNVMCCKGPRFSDLLLCSELAAASYQARRQYWDICSIWFGLSCRTKGSICVNQDLCCLSRSEPASTALKLHQKSAIGRLESCNTARQLRYWEFPPCLKYITKIWSRKCVIW